MLMFSEGVRVEFHFKKNLFPAQGRKTEHWDFDTFVCVVKVFNAMT